MLEKMDRGENLPESPNEVGEVPLQEMLEKELGRDLTESEENYLDRVEKRFRRFEMSGEITDHDLVRLSNKWEVESYDALELWPHPPGNILEFWNDIAYVFQRKNAPYPKFMDAITDLEATREKMLHWEKEREIQGWKDRLREIAETGPSTPVQTLEFRLMVTTTEARLQSRTPGSDDDFISLQTEEAISDLADAHRDGALRLDPLSDLIWSHFNRHWENTETTELRLDHRLSAELLNRLFHQEALRERILTLDESPFQIFKEPLEWICRDDDLEAAGHYTLQIATGDGEDVPHSLRVLPGVQTLYLTDVAVFPGPPNWTRSTEILPRFEIPAQAVESPRGVDFLGRLKARLPKKLQERVDDRFLFVTISAKLIENSQVKDQELLTLSVTATDVEGMRKEELEKEGWKVVEEEKADGEKLRRFDRSLLHLFPDLLDPVVSSWDVDLNAFKHRLTKRFPEKFYEWTRSLPSEIELELDDKLRTLVRDPVKAGISFEINERGIDWFDLKIKLDADGLDLKQEEIRALVAARGDFVRMQDGSWMRLEIDLGKSQQEAITRLGLDPYDLSGEEHRMHVLQLADPLAKEVFSQDAWSRICERSNSLKLQVQPKLPSDLKVSLRPYQVEGFQFLSYLSTNHFGGILADDMGLGKTVQSLAWLLWLRQRNEGDLAPGLVVCPKSVLDVWAGEVEKFAPDLDVQILRNKDELDVEHVEKHIDLLVLNYAQLRNRIEELKKINWLAVVLDEGQQIKNPDSKAAKASQALTAQNRLVLTGTPIENRLMDIWSLMAFAMPGILGDRRYFREKFDRRKDADSHTRLAARVRPFLLRRTKGQVAMDLPTRTEEDVLCKMEDQQELLYQQELDRIRAVLLGLETDEALRKNSFVILQGLMRLRQLCCHPALIDPDNANAGSAKFDALFYLLDQLQDEGHKVLVFSQFTSMLELIRARLDEENRPHTLLTGQTRNRREVVENFQRSKDPTCFLLSLKAGGSGLNLTAASYVILYDPWWNPAVENQAIDRTHRIGQKNQVIAYRLLIRDTVEEKIRILQRQKSAMMTGVLGEESFARNLRREDLEFLFQREPEDEKSGSLASV
ncbi:MAG: SNF2-related protein [Acidobacteriota bacterium]